MKTIRTLVSALALVLLTGGEGFAQWVQSASISNSAVMAFGRVDSVLFAGTDGDGSYRSTDNGTTWTRMAGGLTSSNGYAFVRFGRYLLLGSMAGVDRSTDMGVTWSSVGLTVLGVRSFLIHQDTILAAGDGGVYLSADSGATWTRTDTQGITVGYNFSLAMIADTILDGSNGAGVFRSTDGGLHWARTSTGLTNSIICALLVHGSTVYAGTTGGMFRSTDSGLSWGGISPSNFYTRGLAVLGTRLFAATMYHGVRYTEDGGANWYAANTGFAGTPTLNAFGTSADRVFVGTYGSGIWYRNISEILTGVQEPEMRLPESAGLLQNYPNPFNPLTRIALRTENSEFLILKVMDQLGREVATLVNEQKDPGDYTVEFDGTGFASGVYFARLQSGERTQVLRMLLLR